MKNPTAILLVIAGIFTGCARSENRTPHIGLNDSTCIKIIADNVDDTLRVQTLFCSFFPFRPCNGKQIEIIKPGTYYLTYRITKPEMVKFEIGEHFQSLLIPGDTLVINVGFETNENKERSVYHKIKNNIYDYYHAKKKKFGYYSFTDLDDNPVSRFFVKMEISKQAYSEAIGILNSSAENKIFFLEKIKNITEWFTDLEHSNITYCAACRAIELYTRLTPDDQKDIPFYKVEFNNPKAHLSSLYYYFLFEYLDYKYPIENINLPFITWKTNQFAKGSNLIDSLLSGETKDYFITCRLADLYFFSNSEENIETANTFITRNFTHLTEDKIRFLNHEKVQKIKYLGIKSNLPRGDKAPRFYLKDVNGTPHELSDFKDKFIFIHFWATWCAPCISDIPALNQLYSNLGNKPVEIINICMDENPDKWKEIIEKKNLKGTNLICKGSWEKSLKRLYFITELPHYTLVDQKGMIINNNCNGPAEISAQIKQLLDNK